MIASLGSSLVLKLAEHSPELTLDWKRSLDLASKQDKNSLKGWWVYFGLFFLTACSRRMGSKYLQTELKQVNHMGPNSCL